jgi:hypothetical protein
MNTDLDRELESNPEYRRVLAGLSPDERLRLLGKDFNLQQQLRTKREYRRALSNLSPSEKLRVLEELRARSQLQQGLRRAPPLNSQPPPPGTRKAIRQHRPRTNSHRFGGRATAAGVRYESRVAAFIAAKMLAGAQCSVWEGIAGNDMASITMQAPEPVDDVVVTLHGDAEPRVFISAKERSKAIALTANSPAFTDTVDAFVRQFLKLHPTVRPNSRLLWAVSPSAGRAVTQDLCGVLEAHRLAADASFSEFSSCRQTRQRKALDALLTAATRAWKKQSGNAPAGDELRQFLSLVFVEEYDFGPGHRLQREIEGEIRSHVVAVPSEAPHAWEKLKQIFLEANYHGVRVDRVSLRKALTAQGIALKSSPDYESEIARLRALTSQNLARLKDHSMLTFGPSDADRIHITRTDEVSSLLGAVKTGHLLITGEPGCGKSGLMHDLVELLQNEKIPVALLLAEDDLPKFDHSLDEIIGNWPDGARGFLITDALDAVRDPERQKAIRNLLREVREGKSGWTVVASVREFDLKHSRELRDAFPGTGVEGYFFNDFAGVAHFHLPRLRDAQLDELAARRPEMLPFIRNARTNTKSGGIHRSPFHLRLAAELLRAGVNSTLLADWHSPAKLLRKFWEKRIGEGAGQGERENALKAVCLQMKDTRRMVVSLKQLTLSPGERSQLHELRSRGIIVSPILRQEMQVGGDEVRFTHHLLHDYAIARALIPETPEPFCDFAVKEPLLPVFYRQSFMFALEELWDAPDGRNGFWKAALRLESVPDLHGLARILAPLLAARRVEALSDLEPLLAALRWSGHTDSHDANALRHLASGLQDTHEDVLRVGATAWCTFAEQLASLLPTKASIEGPLVHIVARLNPLASTFDAVQGRALNAAGRGLLAHHVQKELSKGWPYAVLVASEAVCRTFSVNAIESECALLRLLDPERLKESPHDDLHRLADSLKYLGANGEIVVLLLFEAAFAREVEPGHWEQRGTAIMGMSVQTSDEWNMIRHVLAEYYERHAGENAGLLAEAACIAWNAVVRRRGGRRAAPEHVLATIQFRGAACDLIEDYGHIWGREFEHEENRILSHFEKLLRKWAAVGDATRLSAAIDRFAVRNRTSLMWTVLMEVGAEYPLTLGILLEEVLGESLFLTHPDYAYGGTELLGALHKTGASARRERLEKLILDLPNNARVLKDEPREPVPPWIEHAQDRLLGALEESNIMLPPVRELRRVRQTSNVLPRNEKRQEPQVFSHTLSDEELVERRGINLKEPPNDEMLRLREALNPFLGRDNEKVNPDEIEHHWPVISKCERALKRYAKSHTKMAEELWGYLVGACESIARHARWDRTSKRWKTVTRILLKAASDPVPEAEDTQEIDEDRWPSWGWPAPRLDAARGLPYVAYRLGQADKAVAGALRRLCRDKYYPLRFNLADRLAALAQSSADLAWELADTFIAFERRFSVLDAVAMSLNRLWTKAPEKVKPRLHQIADHASKNASDNNRIHTTLAGAHLFQFLRTRDADCEGYIASLIAECDSQRASQALLAQLHACREGGWLTAGDGLTPDERTDQIRARTWGFFSRHLTAAQAKLRQHREALRELHKTGQSDDAEFKAVQEKLVRTMHLVDGVAMQLYFASGAFDERTKKDEKQLTPAQFRRFWEEASPLLTDLSSEQHPHTAHHVVQTLHHLLRYAPRDIFLLAAKSIRSSAAAGFQHEPLAVGDVVRLIQRALADHRDIFQSRAGQESDCLVALLGALDLFVEAGWAEARQLTHRLEEIYR